MVESLQITLSRSSLSLIFLLSVQGWTILGTAPQGCWFNNGRAGCTFSTWSPPLLDEDFGPEQVYDLSLNVITGDIPAGAFSGLNGSRTEETTHIRMNCGIGKMTLSRNIFTPNLNWVTNLLIFNCYLENGLPSRLLENLKSLKSLAIMGPDGVIEGAMAYDAFAGLTALHSISVNAPVLNGRLPSGIFDGLVNLTLIHLRDAMINFIPLDWFKGLVRLRWIHLSYNNLQTLPPGLFDDLSSLKSVGLDNNPWNCSCDLMWLLDWSNIADGFACQAPTFVVNVNLEDAFEVLGCTSSTPFTPSTQVTSATKTTDIQTYSNRKSYASSKLNLAVATLETTSRFVDLPIATTFQMKQITSVSTLGESSTKPVRSTTNPISLTNATKITTLTPTGLTSRTVSVPSHTPSTADDIRTIANALSFSLLPTASSTIYSLAKTRSARHNLGGINDGILTDVRFIAVISTLGALTVMIVALAIMYQYARQNRYNGSPNRNDNNESGKQRTDPQTRNSANSITMENP